MTTTRLAVYSADNVTLSIGGYVIDSGYADGEFVSVEPAADAYGIKVGADGEVVRYKMNNRSGTVHIKLSQASLGNNLLTQLHASDRNAPNGAGIGALILVDRTSGVQLVYAPKCWISKLPTVSLGREASERDWTAMCSSIDWNQLGAPSV